jgi:hypothetical protein
MTRFLLLALAFVLAARLIYAFGYAEGYRVALAVVQTLRR